MPHVAEMRVIPADVASLMRFTRNELRQYAKDIGVDCGTKKFHTAHNLWISGKATLLVQLGD
jgi:hypothetical protein